MLSCSLRYPPQLYSSPSPQYIPHKILQEPSQMQEPLALNPYFSFESTLYFV